MAHDEQAHDEQDDKRANGSSRDERDSVKEAAAWAGSHSALERTLQAGIHGAPELRPEEKRYFLGEYRERVLKVLTKKQLGEAEIYDEIRTALADPRADKLVIDGSTPDRHNDKYEKLAASLGKQSTTRRDSELQGDLGLVVVSGRAVDLPDEEIRVKTREEKLRDRGIPDLLIQAAGKKVCVKCYALIQEKAPEEKGRYRVMTMLDRLFGEKCPGHEE